MTSDQVIPYQGLSNASVGNKLWSQARLDVFATVYDDRGEDAHDSGDDTPKLENVAPWLQKMWRDNQANSNHSKHVSGDIELGKLVTNCHHIHTITKPEISVIAMPMLENQQRACQWMMNMELTKAGGGIIGHDSCSVDMLPQVVNLIANHRPGPDDVYKTTVIVIQPIHLEWWSQQLREHLEPDQKVGVFYGEEKALWNHYDAIAKMDVMVTSYRALSDDYRKGKWSVWFGTNKKFYRVILYDGESIKGLMTDQSRAAAALPARHRFCLMKEPQLDRIVEFKAYVRFINVAPYNNLTTFENDVTDPWSVKRKNDDDCRRKSLQRLEAFLSVVYHHQLQDYVPKGNPVPDYILPGVYRTINTGPENDIHNDEPIPDSEDIGANDSLNDEPIRAQLDDYDLNGNSNYESITTETNNISFDELNAELNDTVFTDMLTTAMEDYAFNEEESEHEDIAVDDMVTTTEPTININVVNDNGAVEKSITTQAHDININITVHVVPSAPTTSVAVSSTNDTQEVAIDDNVPPANTEVINEQSFSTTTGGDNDNNDNDDEPFNTNTEVEGDNNDDDDDNEMIYDILTTMIAYHDLQGISDVIDWTTDPIPDELAVSFVAPIPKVADIATCIPGAFIDSPMASSPSATSLSSMASSDLSREATEMNDWSLLLSSEAEGDDIVNNDIGDEVLSDDSLL